MTHACESAGLPTPTFESNSGGPVDLPKSTTPQVEAQVTPEVERMLRLFSGEMTRQEIMAVLALRDEKHFREHYQQAAINAGVIEMTIPDKPKSRLQKYRITPKGRALIAQ